LLQHKYVPAKQRFPNEREGVLGLGTKWENGEWKMENGEWGDYALSPCFFALWDCAPAAR